jgi:phthalate 4,5-cis-dihydrodiol dehydrogenase
MTGVRLGIAGVGIAALQVLEDLKELEDRIELTALADIRADNMAYFQAELGRSLAWYDTVEAMCAQGPVDAVWVASPNRLHAEHVIAAARHGKHVICEKPMAVTLEQCAAMVEAVEAAGVKYVQGHSKVFDAPVRAIGQLVRSGELGRVIHLNTWNFNDWLIRALTPEEVRTDLGAGPVFRQGPHQVDTIRYLAGGRVRSVRAVADRHEPHFPDCEGNYTAFLEFEDGTPATLVFDGYGYFDTVELTWGVGEAGKPAKNPDSRIPKYRPQGPVSAEEKYAQVRGGNPYGYGAGGGWQTDAPQQQPFYGLTVVACERGVIRQSPNGLYVYDVNGRRELPCPPPLGRAAELVELYEAVANDRPTLLDVRWGMASTEVVLGILESSRSRSEVRMRHQTDAPVL